MSGRQHPVASQAASQVATHETGQPTPPAAAPQDVAAALERYALAQQQVETLVRASPEVLRLLQRLDSLTYTYLAVNGHMAALAAARLGRLLRVQGRAASASGGADHTQPPRREGGGR